MAAILILAALLVSPLPVRSQQNLNATASCSDAYKYTPGSDFGKNVQVVLQTLLQEAPAAGYKSFSQGSITGSDTSYGLLQCRGDITTEECKSCAAAAVRIVNNTCVRNSTKGGRVFLETCFLRYEDHFFASLLDTVSNQVNCSLGNRTAAFDSNSKLVLNFIQSRVPESERKFTAAVAGLGSASPVYALGQCIQDLSSQDCSACLSDALDVLSRTCTASPGGVCYFPTCSLLYQGSKFFQGIPENATLSSKGKSSSNKGLVIGLPIAGVVVLVALVLGWFFYMRKRREKHKPGGGVGAAELDELEITLHRGPVTFSYELLRNATEDFSDVHKLGEGGFGAVYKGTFRDGTELAIKKLSVASKQGEQQFLNEVKVISSVQHRNLVKLLGCCVHGSERLLVYEFLRNNSLERALFGSGEVPDLPWQTRYNILLGTARGLTYLHEDSQVRIVHRDIKPSNILLDDSFEAKIADFGLARLYGDDETSEIITTKVAGTYGYMAPEYAFHGHLSEKADVFSFGIVLLETVSGRKNRDVTLPEEEQYLLEWAWQLHSEGRLGSLLDPALVTSDNGEANRKLMAAVEIALLCTQASPQARPTMSHVVAMLSGHSNVQVPLGTSFDVSLKPLTMFSQASSSAASSDSKHKPQRQNLSKTFSEPLPR